jgi:hypothetical protein
MTLAMQVWRVEQFELKEVAEDRHGCFTSGDCYLIVYAYGTDTPQFLVYMWQGSNSTQDERGACAMHAVKLDDELCQGSAPQVRDAAELQRFLELLRRAHLLQSCWWGGM